MDEGCDQCQESEKSRINARSGGEGSTAYGTVSSYGVFPTFCCPDGATASCDKAVFFVTVGALAELTQQSTPTANSRVTIFVAAVKKIWKNR